ncbi:hypothetical protein CsSME_00019449 [Camellia sinensis var. sinensis]
MLSKEGATFRYHTVCHGAIQTGGNFPLSCSSLQARGNFPSDLRLCISRVGSMLVEHWPFAKIIFENFYRD